MDVTLYVGNLPEATDEHELLNLFTQMGDVSTIRIMRDRHTGRSRGYGYVAMTAQSEADRAVSRLNESDFNGETLKVSLTMPRVVRGVPRPQTPRQRPTQRKTEE